MKKNRIVPAIVLALSLGGAVSVVASTPSAEAAGCTISATAPWTSGKTIYVRASSSCNGTLKSYLKWSIHGPDQTLANSSVYGRSATVSKACTWGAPKDRNIYSYAVRGSATATSGVKGYTSKNKGRCTK